MRYLPMLLGALLLSVGVFAGCGPVHATMPTLALDRPTASETLVEKAGYYYRRRYSHPTLMAIDLTGPITAMATEDPTTVTDMAVAGGTKSGRGSRGESRR